MGIPGRPMAVRICRGPPGRPYIPRNAGRLCWPRDYFLVGIPWWWITAWGFTRFMDIYQRSTLRWETRWKPGPCWEKWERRGESRDRTCIGAYGGAGAGKSATTSEVVREFFGEGRCARFSQTMNPMKRMRWVGH